MANVVSNLNNADQLWDRGLIDKESRKETYKV